MKVDGEYVRGTAERDVAELLAEKPQTRVRRMKLHSADAESASEMAVAVAIAAADDRVRVSGRVVGFEALGIDDLEAGVADAMEGTIGAFPCGEVAMRGLNVHDEGAIALAWSASSARRTRWRNTRRRWRRRRGFARGRATAVWTRGADDSRYRKPLSRLRWLDLGSNMIGDRGAVAISDALGPNVPITRLNLRDNAVGMHGCAALGRAAARCVTLRRLDLAPPKFGDAGATALARGFAAAADAERSTSLRVLQLGFNSIGVEVSRRSSRRTRRARSTNSSISTSRVT